MSDYKKQSSASASFCHCCFILHCCEALFTRYNLYRRVPTLPFCSGRKSQNNCELMIWRPWNHWKCGGYRSLECSLAGILNNGKDASHPIKFISQIIKNKFCSFRPWATKTKLNYLCNLSTVPAWKPKDSLSMRG